MGRQLSSILLLIVLIELTLRSAECGYCTESYSCSSTCYTRTCSSHKCGFWHLNRCRSCRTKSYDCHKTCYRHVCCAGYTGSYCDNAICFGSTECPNGGSCRTPDQCSCRPGFSFPKCHDIDECLTGEANCSHNCTNTPGSYSCSCREGYQLSYDVETCEDINECYINNGGCEHKCTNTDGSFICSCNKGYNISTDGLSCQDIDECAADTHECNQHCQNTVGSYTCYCKDGFTLDMEGLTCNDSDECASGEHDCEQVCINEHGSYSCTCVAGYTVSTNDTTQCEDINECADDNGGCSDECANSDGSFWCPCPTGFALYEDQRTCKEINECKDGTALCEHNCTKTHPSYVCTCNNGYRLKEDTFSCEDIDDCDGVTCYNGGTCVDGVAHYTCRCLPGFTDLHCETDLNECDILNGGCEESCTNTAGSYHCGCEEPHTLRDNGLSCSNSNSSQHQSGLTLPVGDFMVDLKGNQKLSSTLKWYRHNSNQNVVYTRGIVHIETGTLTLPLSMTGIQIDVSNINTMSRSVELTEDDGTQLLNTRDGADATELELTQTDIVAFVSSSSFTESYFKGIQAALPDWASLSKDASSALPIQELSTKLITGDQLSTIPLCVGAPVFADRTYNSFVTTADIVVRLFGEDAKISKTTSESKVCILIELTTGLGGTIFVMFPDRFPNELFKMSPFSSINNADSITFNDIDGFAFSTDKGISVKAIHDDTSLAVWNGDHDFNYRLPSVADVWLKAYVKIKTGDINLDVTADLFLSIPNPLNLLTDTFEDKWEIFLAVEKSNGRLFIDPLNLKFEIEDFILSIGGQDKRTECGANANPAGFFGTITWLDEPVLRENQPLELNRLVVELLQNTYLSVKTKLFVSAGDYENTVSISSELFENKFEFLLYQIGACAENLTSLITATLRNDLGTLLHLADNFTTSLDLFQSTYSHLNSPTMVVNRALELTHDLRNILQDIITISVTVTDLGDILTDGLECIQLNINTLAELLQTSTQASSVALTNSISNSNGFGIQVKNSVTLHLTENIDLSLDLVVIEYVSSKQGLGQCGQFHRAYALFEDEEAYRFNIRLIKGIPVGLLFGIPVGLLFGIPVDLSGIGYAVSKESDKFVLQALFEFFPFKTWFHRLIIKFEVNTFITNQGLHAYGEVGFLSDFYIQLDVTIEFHDRQLDNLNVHVGGRFISSDEKDTKSEYTNGRERFSQFYLEDIVKLLEEIADNAKRRVGDVQKRVTEAKAKVHEIQNWLESKKTIVASAKLNFDKANEFLMDRQKDVENAKDVFETAADILKEARDKVDRLCTIRRCRRICIPGLRCEWFSCSWTNCMISFDDPICVAKNVLCSIVRKATFLVYDAAIAALNIPLLALDVANAALWTAQIAVDQAKNGLNLANAALDLAQVGLEGVKKGLDIANSALDLVKIAVDVGLRILKFIVLDSIQSIIDVRNCGFAFDIDRPINPTFGITCEINIFKSGWTNVQIRINFINPLQSIWHAAKSTFNEIINRLGIISRRKRELRQTYESSMYPLIRKIRQVNGTDSKEYLSSIVDFALPLNLNSGENTTSSNSDYDEKVNIYRNKCTVVQQVYRFMRTAFSNLTAKCEDLKEKADELETNITELATYTSDMFDGITLEDSGIDESVAIAEFNMTNDGVAAAFAEGLDSIKTSSYVKTLLDMSSNTSTKLAEQKHDIEHLPVLTDWASNFNESIAAYFDPEECVDIYDCIHVGIHRLAELFLDEHVDGQAHQTDTIDEIESVFLALLNASDVDIYNVLNASNQITGYLEDFVGSIYFCDEAPVIQSSFENATAVVGRNLTYRCNATGDGVLNYTWYKNNTVVPLETNAILFLRNVTTDIHQATYSCSVGNNIALAGSSLSYLTVLDTCRPGTMEVLGFCIPCAVGTYQEGYGLTFCDECQDGFTTRQTGSTSGDECVLANGSNGEPKETMLIVVLSSTFSVLGLVILIAVGVYMYRKKIGKFKEYYLKNKRTCTNP